MGRKKEESENKNCKNLLRCFTRISGRSLSLALLACLFVPLREREGHGSLPTLRLNQRGGCCCCYCCCCCCEPLRENPLSTPPRLALPASRVVSFLALQPHNFFSASHTPQAAAQGTLIASAISLVFPPLLQPQPEASPAASTAGSVAENPPAASVIRGGKRPSRSSSGCSLRGGRATASPPPCTGRPLAEP